MIATYMHRANGIKVSAEIERKHNGDGCERIKKMEIFRWIFLSVSLWMCLCVCYATMAKNKCNFFIVEMYTITTQLIQNDIHTKAMT